MSVSLSIASLMKLTTLRISSIARQISYITAGKIDHDEAAASLVCLLLTIIDENTANMNRMFIFSMLAFD